MNIFIVDLDPRQAARDLCDQHVVKMVTESAQMLSTVHHKCNSIYKDFLYKPAHAKHPCTLWAAESFENYKWLLNHYQELSLEYTRRFHKEHAAYHRLIGPTISGKPIKMGDFLVKGDPIYPIFPKQGLTPFAIAMKQYPQCIVPDNAVESYRNYYRDVKRNFARWRYCDAPDWFTKG